MWSSNLSSILTSLDCLCNPVYLDFVWPLQSCQHHRFSFQHRNGHCLNFENLQTWIHCFHFGLIAVALVFASSFIESLSTSQFLDFIRQAFSSAIQLTAQKTLKILRYYWGSFRNPFLLIQWHFQHSIATSSVACFSSAYQFISFFEEMLDALIEGSGATSMFVDRALGIFSGQV